MKTAPIFTKNNKSLRLYASNTKPHNFIFFNDNDFMKYVKSVLFNDYQIVSIMIDTKNTILSMCNIFDYEYNENITGFLYINSRNILDPDIKNDDYYKTIYAGTVYVEL